MARVALALLVFASAPGCESAAAEQAQSPSLPGPTGTPEAPSKTCPVGPVKVDRSPGTQAAHERLETWIKPSKAGNSSVLMSPEEVGAFNESAAQIEGAWRPLDAPELAQPQRVQAQIDERVQWMAGQVSTGQYSERVPGSFDAAQARVHAALPVDEFRAIAKEANLRCMPLSVEAPLFKRDPKIEDEAAPDPDFDRNNCASLHVGEWVRVLRRSAAQDGSDEWIYVHAGHSVGWLRAPALTPAVDAEGFARWQSHTPVVALHDEVRSEAGRVLRMGGRSYYDAEAKRAATDKRVPVWLATPQGWVRDEVSAAEVNVGPEAFTRARVVTRAFGELNAPYGWGGRAGERDCSRYLRDVFAGFGAQLARHSAVQAKHAPLRIDVSGLNEAQKLERIAQAHARGVVLLYMRGHIMLYLGEAERDDGTTGHYAISSISEYLEPCEGASASAPARVFRLDRVAVTTLELGRGTQRRAFIERIETLAVFGGASDLQARADAG